MQDIFWFVAKVAFFMYLYIWYRGTFPRYRFDQLMRVGWKVLLPIGLGVLIATALVGLLPQMSSAIWGWCNESGRAGRASLQARVQADQLVELAFRPASKREKELRGFSPDMCRRLKPARD